MSCEVYEKRQVKFTRKDHVCEYCGETIPAGSPAFYEHGIFCGQIFGRYCCSACEPFMSDFWDFMDGEAIIRNDFPDWVRQERIPHPTLTCEVECPSCGKVRVMRDDWEHDSWVFCPNCDALLERSE